MNNSPQSSARPIGHYAAITIAPVLLFCLPLLLKGYYGPYFLGYNSDPEYAYLFNSLNIIHMAVPGHIDHPGTTVQLLGAAGLMVKWLGHFAVGNHLSFNDLVLIRPEGSLTVINFIINLFVLAAFVFSSFSIYRTMRDIGLVLIFQLSILIPLQIKLSLFRVAPEPLLVFSVLILSGLIVRYQKYGSAERYWFKIPLLVGFTIGFGIVTKVTFLPILVLIALFPTNRERLITLCGCVAALLLFTLPIVSQYGKMFAWFGSIVTHRGKYGRGGVGLPPIAELVNNFLEIIGKEPFLFIFAACYVSYLIFRRFSSKRDVTDGRGKLLILGTVVLLGQTAMTVKHPGIHYMLPAIALTALLNLKMAEALKQTPRSSQAFLGYRIFFAMIFAGMIYGCYTTVSWALDAKNYFAEEVAISNKVKAMSGCSVIPYYRSSSIDFALSFGNSWSDGRYGKELSSIYPDRIFYNAWNGYFYGFESRYDVANKSLVKNRCMLLAGFPLQEDKRNDLVLTPLVESPRSAVYKLEGFKY
jgi:hypothetical protein